ncbi:hypothetical protein [Yersinia phage vB_YenM_P778]
MNNVFVHQKIAEFLKITEELVTLDKDIRRIYHSDHRRMVDIQHEIELSENYSDEMKINVFNHAKEVSKLRRQSKDTILVLDALEKLLQNGTSLGSLKDALHIASEEAKRNYAPREIKTLDFSDGETLRESRKHIDFLRKMAE